MASKIGRRPWKGSARAHSFRALRFVTTTALKMTTKKPRNIKVVLASFAHRRIGIYEDADHDPARAHQQHATVRHHVSIIPGLRHAGGDLVGHGAQLDPRRSTPRAAGGHFQVGQADMNGV